MESNQNKAKFNTYLIIWAVAIIAYSIVFFMLPDYLTDRFEGRFWAAWIVSVVFMGLQAYISGKGIFFRYGKSPMFYNFPLLAVSYVSVILVVGICLAMTIFRLPVWISVILCTVVVAANIILGTMAGSAASFISGKDESVKIQREFIVNATARVNILMSKGIDGKAGSALKDLYEAFRYSDPMTSDGLNDIESLINIELKNLENAVNEKNESTICELGDKIKSLINERNILCKSFK